MTHLRAIVLDFAIPSRQPQVTDPNPGRLIQPFYDTQAKKAHREDKLSSTHHLTVLSPTCCHAKINDIDVGNTQGNEVGRIDLEISQDGAADRAAEFVNQYAPPQLDAEQKWKKAFDEAKKSDRKVWACIGGRYCGPCFRLARWQDDHRDMLAQDYVMLKIDDFHDQNGRQVAEHLTRGRQHGIPFHAIFDIDGEMLIDSAGPLGNIGHPSGYEGKKYLRKMLLETRQRLTDAAIDQLVDSLSD